MYKDFDGVRQACLPNLSHVLLIDRVGCFLDHVSKPLVDSPSTKLDLFMLPEHKALLVGISAY